MHMCYIKRNVNQSNERKKNRSPLRSVQGYSYGMDGFLNQNNLKLCLHENTADKRLFFFSFVFTFVHCLKHNFSVYQCWETKTC